MVVTRRKMTSRKKSGPKPGKERILDAAERLFARHGFYGISVRDITEEAGVDVALVSYHFGGKRELFAAVFQRRAELLNPERLAMLEEVRRTALPGVPTLEDIVNAFTYPLLERSARGGHTTRLRILVRAVLGRYRRPVPGATVRFADKHVHTNRRGRATVRVHLRLRARAYRIRIRGNAPGLGSVRASVRVSPK